MIALLLAAAVAPNHVYVYTGAEYGLVSGAGYAREVGDVLVGGELAVPWGGFDGGDWRLRARATAPPASGERWKLFGSVAPTLRGASDEAVRMLGVGVDLGAVGGYYAPGWFAAAEAGVDWSLAAHLTSTDAYRRLVYDGARDGWYRAPGATFRAGLQLGARFARADLVLRAGRLIDASGKPPMLPFFATLALDTHF